MSGKVHYSVDGNIASVVFDRPEARNAMTWGMYEELAAACERIASDSSLRVATFRGAGGEAFVAGTDIEQFRSFKTGEDGINYEKVINARIDAIESLPIPTIAIVDGWATGGGLAICVACDFRIATPKARFGIPTARTLGNCISMANMARIVATFGVARAKRILMMADMLGAEEAFACGFIAEIAEAGEIDAQAKALCAKLAANAPITMYAAKEGIRRLRAAGIPDGADLIRKCYGSNDFHEGVEAFLSKKKPIWTGT